MSRGTRRDNPFVLMRKCETKWTRTKVRKEKRNNHLPLRRLERDWLAVPASLPLRYAHGLEFRITRGLTTLHSASVSLTAPRWIHGYYVVILKLTFYAWNTVAHRSIQTLNFYIHYNLVLALSLGIKTYSDFVQYTIDHGLLRIYDEFEDAKANSMYMICKNI